MSETEKRRGRQEEYTDEQLDDFLIEFTTKNPTKNLNLSQLEKQFYPNRNGWFW
ncbi:hypothetical protein MKZ07_24895 [Paenibacillus sp. FSL P4-0338]|uniref:hypothetical protein n=1 Tax=unclassified Paenibacillus TaxID=185978 RepID=UPI0012EC23DE|nr:hypothetical protein [Paenibacillus sp. FSL R7-269]